MDLSRIVTTSEINWAPNIFTFAEQGVAMLSGVQNNVEKHDEEITLIFDAIRKLMAPPAKTRRKIGFKRKGGADDR